MNGSLTKPNTDLIKYLTRDPQSSSPLDIWMKQMNNIKVEEIVNNSKNDKMIRSRNITYTPIQGRIMHTRDTITNAFKFNLTPIVQLNK